MHLTFVWHQYLLDPAPLSRPQVLPPSAYQDVFGQGSWSNTFTAPWPLGRSQGFWEKYLRIPSLISVGVRQARRQLVPLRVDSPVTVIPQLENVEAMSEGFLHSWGSALAVTLFLFDMDLPLEDVAPKVLDLRKTPCFRSDEGAINLDRVAAAGLATLEQHAATAVPGPVSECFSIFTPVIAHGERETFDPSVGEVVARLLHATCSFSPSWEQDALPELSEAKVAGIAAAPASHLVYGRRRARTIWSPESFLSTEAGMQTLSCHHRNLVLASMQTDALARFAADTAERLASNRTLSAEHRSESKSAVEILKDLYEGSRGTYKSGSVKAQVDQNSWLAPINSVRTHSAFPPIA